MGKPKEEKDMAVLSKAYLILYNGVQTIGWGYMLSKTIKFLLEKRTSSGLWNETGLSVTIFQTLACLEVIHCAVKLVPSSVLVTLLQVFSRVFMVWGILVPVENSQNAPSLALTLIAWGITEVVRYSYYFFSQLGSPPKFLTWCRYTFFYALYPIGVSGELGNIFYALNTIKQRQLYYISLPNSFNVSFNFSYACLLLVASYVPLFPQLFNHMRHQRKKILGGAGSKVEKKVH